MNNININLKKEEYDINVVLKKSLTLCHFATSATGFHRGNMYLNK